MHRFRISTIIYDDTGGLQVTLFDREVHTLLGKTVQQVQTKVSPTKKFTL